MSCIPGLTRRRVDWAAIQRGREADRCASDEVRDAFLADKESAFAKLVPARPPAYNDRGVP